MDYTINTANLPIKHIDFMSAWGKKRKLDEILENDEITQKVQVSKDDATPADDEMELFFKDMSLSSNKIAILSLIPEYCIR